MTTLKDLLEPGTGHTMTPRRALVAVGYYLDREAAQATPQEPAEVVLTWEENWLIPAGEEDPEEWAWAWSTGAWELYVDGCGVRLAQGKSVDRDAARREVERRLPAHVRVTNPATPQEPATVVFGIPVYVDPAMPPGTVELRTSTQTARAVNIGDGQDPNEGSGGEVADG